MQKCVHVVKVLTATKNDDQVAFLAMEPVLDSVLSNYINTGPTTRATMFGYKQIENMVKKGNAVQGKKPGGDDIIIGKLYREEDDDLSDNEVRNIVSKSVGSINLSGIGIQEGAPGQSGNKSCVSVGGAVCLSYEVRKGYTTFYVRGEDTNLFNDGFRRRYSIVNWNDNRGSGDSQLMVVDADSGEFIDILNDSSVFGRHVENAYRISMAEDVDVTIQSSKIAKRTTYVAEGAEKDIEVENLTKDPAEVAGKSLAIVAKESRGYSSIVVDKSEEKIEGEGMAALAGARDKGFLKEGGTVMMPEHEDTISVVELESLFD